MHNAPPPRLDGARQRSQSDCCRTKGPPAPCQCRRKWHFMSCHHRARELMVRVYGGSAVCLRVSLCGMCAGHLEGMLAVRWKRRVALHAGACPRCQAA